MLRFILLIKGYNEYSTLDILYILEYFLILYAFCPSFASLYLHKNLQSNNKSSTVYIIYTFACYEHSVHFSQPQISRKMHPNIQFSRESSPSSPTSCDSSQSWSAVSRLISVRTRKAAKWKKGLAYSLFFPSAGPVSSICGYLATYRVSLCMYASCMLQRCRISRFRTCKETSSASFPRFPCPIVCSVHAIVG